MAFFGAFLAVETVTSSGNGRHENEERTSYTSRRQTIGVREVKKDCNDNGQTLSR